MEVNTKMIFILFVVVIIFDDMMFVLRT